MKLINLLVVYCFLWNFSLLAMDDEEAKAALVKVQQSATYDEYFAKIAIPRLFKNVQKLLARLIEIDAHSDAEALSKINHLDSALRTLVSHFQNLVINPKPLVSPKKTQSLRTMITVLNTEQYVLLPGLLEQFDKSDSFQIEPKPMTSEKELFNFLKRIFFHCSLIIGDVNIVLKPSTKDKKVMEEAIVSYLLQEAKELSQASKEQFEAYKKILEIQTEYNNEKLWSGFFSITNSIEYMILRRPNPEQRPLYEEVLKRILQVNPKQPKHPVIVNGIDQEKYQVVYCTLKRPGTWNLKNYELLPGFAIAKSVISKLALVFKSKIAQLIKNGFEKEQFIAKGESSLDKCFDSFVEAIIQPSMNIFMKRNGFDKFSDQVLPEVEDLFFNLYELADKAERQSSRSMQKITLESILKTAEDGFNSIIDTYLVKPVEKSEDG